MNKYITYYVTASGQVRDKKFEADSDDAARRFAADFCSKSGRTFMTVERRFA